MDNAYTNKPLYNCTTVFPENDDSLTRRVPNWYQYFADKGLLYSGDKPYQVGDVIFLKDEQGIPNHSAIVTRINPKTGEPLQIVGASWTTETVKPYSWEEWKKVNHQNSFEHGGFRPPDYKE